MKKLNLWYYLKNKPYFHCLEILKFKVLTVTKKSIKYCFYCVKNVAKCSEWPKSYLAKCHKTCSFGSVNFYQS